MINNNLKALAVPIDQLHSLPGNPRVGDVAAVARSLERFGQRKPIVARHADGVIIAGNHTWQAAKQLGWTEIAVVWTDDDDDTMKAFALADNRTAELGSYDEQALKKMIAEVQTADPELLRDTGYSDDDVRNLLQEIQDSLTDSVDDSKNDVDDIPPVSKLGDLWKVGPHRILCGDSQDTTTLNRVLDGLTVGAILTDPPYGINLDTDYSSGGGRTYRRVENDDRPFDASFLRKSFAHVKEQYWWGANYYRRTLSDDDLHGSWLVWDKRTPAMDSVVGSGFELCWSAQKHKQDLLRYPWTNFTSHVNEGHKRMHPTEKPIPMLREIIDRWIPEKCVVFDPFAGSGSTLIAAARSGRTAVGVELDPRYVDAIVKRLEVDTKQTAELVTRHAKPA